MLRRLLQRLFPSVERQPPRSSSSAEAARQTRAAEERSKQHEMDLAIERERHRRY